MDNQMHLDIDELKAIRKKICTLDQNHQQKELKKVSPYSEDITSHIQSCDELKFYISLHLQESYVTRPALVADVDPELWIESEKATNLELMMKGRPPYAFDAPEGKFELHHIGQGYSSPFVELTQEEHNQKSHILHTSDDPSWRNNKKQENAFNAERTAYWIKRSQGECIIAELPENAVPEVSGDSRQDYLEELRKICEEIYKQSEIDDLDYLADLAKSYAMMHRIGALSMGEFLKNERLEQNKDICCTSCSASNYVHFGTYHSQGEYVQRYKCKTCGKVFTATAQTLLSGSSFSFRDWIKFIDCLYNGFNLGQIAKTCGVSEHTVMENRTKLFYALKILNDQVILEGNVAIDEKFEYVSYKGNHSKQEGFLMPRKAHERGGEIHTKGITNEFVSIVCAVDDCGNSVCKVTGTGNASAGKLKYVLQPHMGEEIICIYSDKSSAIRSYAQKCNYNIKQEKLLVKGAKRAENVTISHESFVVNRYIQIVNSYISRLTRFLDRFAGVSTKYLSGYLYLFAWKERNKERDPMDAYKELLLTMATPNNYVSAKEIIESGYLPDAVKINEEYRKKVYIPSSRDSKIRDQYIAGNTMTVIGQECTITPQAVSLIIKKLKKAGYACSAERDIEKDPTIVKVSSRIKRKVMDNLIRDYQIYDARQQWTGPSDEFYLLMANKYGITPQRVRNIVAQIKQFIRLKDEIFIHEEISYESTEQVYKSIYADYLALMETNPTIRKEECYNKLAQKYGFKPSNIYRILHIMTTETRDEYFKSERRLTPAERHKRNKAIFIDFLRWSGRRSDFCRHASKKYGLSFVQIETLLKYCLYADPKRFGMV